MNAKVAGAVAAAAQVRRAKLKVLLGIFMCGKVASYSCLLRAYANSFACRMLNRNRCVACHFFLSIRLAAYSAHSHRMFNFIKRNLRQMKKKSQTKCCDKNTTTANSCLTEKQLYMQNRIDARTHSKEMRCELVANFICRTQTKGAKKMLKEI